MGKQGKILKAVCGRESTFVSEVKMLDVYFWAVRVPALLILYCLIYIFLLDVSVYYVMSKAIQLQAQRVPGGCGFQILRVRT
jgi:hypothetical protein